MSKIVWAYPEAMELPEGERYMVRVYARPRSDGMWEGWLEFRSDNGSVVLRTGIETVQSSQDALVGWASRLEPAYFDGALARARRHAPAA